MQVEEQIAREQQLITLKPVCQGRSEKFVYRRYGELLGSLFTGDLLRNKMAEIQACNSLPLVFCRVG